MRVIERVDSSFWEEVARACPHATFFHTPYWSELMSSTFSYVDITKGFVFDDGTRAVFPLMCRKGSLSKGFLNDYISGPPYYYGGPISDKELTQQQLAEIIESVKFAFKRYFRIVVRGNPFGPDIKMTGFKEIQDLSHVVELFKCRDEEDLFKNYMKSYRRQIKSAIKANVLTIKEGTTIEEYEKLYEIYQQTLKYWGNSIVAVYPLALFKNIFNFKNRYISFWTVYYKDKMIGGDITLCWNDYCHSLKSFHDREYSKLYARRYLEHKIFLHCMEEGIKYYDFLQSGGLKGVEFFKRSMGGREYPHKAWVKERTLLKKVASIKRSMISLLQ